MILEMMSVRTLINCSGYRVATFETSYEIVVCVGLRDLFEISYLVVASILYEAICVFKSFNHLRFKIGKNASRFLWQNHDR